MRKGKNLRTQFYYGGLPPFSGQAQVDATAQVEDDDEHCGSDGARATEGLREKEEEK